MTDPTLKYRAQHKKRLSFMPWLYWRLKPEQREWAENWQREWQSYLTEMETVIIEGDCFISPEANLFAERGRPIVIQDKSFIAANTVLHGPLSIGTSVGINHHVTMDGGSKGIHVGDHCRIAAHCSLYAFNHRSEKGRAIHNQTVSSKGITLEKDVWLGSHAAITDGTHIKKGVVIGMNSVVTPTSANNIPEHSIAAGNPAAFIKRRD